MTQETGRTGRAAPHDVEHGDDANLIGRSFASVHGYFPERRGTDAVLAA